MFGKPKPYTAVGPILEGLPVPSGSMGIVNLLPEGFNIQIIIGKNKTDWKTFELSLDKVEAVQIYNQHQLQQIVEQSVPGMVLGAAAFGVVGAMIGGRTQTKEKMKTKNLLIIDYVSGEKKQLVFDVTDNIKDSNHLVSHFKELKPVQNQTIQL